MSNSGSQETVEKPHPRQQEHLVQGQRLRSKGSPDLLLGFLRASPSSCRIDRLILIYRQN